MYFLLSAYYLQVQKREKMHRFFPATNSKKAVFLKVYMSFVLKYFDFYVSYIQSDPLSDCTETQHKIGASDSVRKFLLKNNQETSIDNND